MPKGFRDKQRRVNVGPVSEQMVIDMVRSFPLLIEALDAETFDQPYPIWVIAGGKREMFQAHMTALKARAGGHT